MTTILLIEDDPTIRLTTEFSLTKYGYAVSSCDDGQSGYETALSIEPDLVLLDVMLPGMNGFEVARNLRNEGFKSPILMLTALDSDEDKIKGLDAGADDYVTKPFSIKQLYARMEAVLRRTVSDLKPLAEKFSWNDHDLQIDFEHNEVRKQDGLLSLTPSEWKILSAMVKYPEKVFTRNDLIDLVFCPDFDGYDRVIDTHIKNLRKKVETDPKSPVYVKTVHGLGYKFGGEEF